MSFYFLLCRAPPCATRTHAPFPYTTLFRAERGFPLHTVSATASELPSETNPFARALGLASRSQLQANGGGLAHKLQPAQTETIDLPWKDCTALVGNASGAKNWVFWHHWPDAKLHDYGAGQGLELRTEEQTSELQSLMRSSNAV